MERPTSYTALLDSSVLFPAFISSLLLWIASTKLYRVRWTEQIHTEWIKGRIERYPDLNRANLERRRQRMNAEFPESLVVGYEGIIESLSLPDSNDRHVLAAAIACRAHVIVTANLRDFPTASLHPYSITAQHPDDFVLDQIDLFSGSSSLVAMAIVQHKLSLSHSKPSWKKYFSFMAQDAILPKTHAALTSVEMKREIKAALKNLRNFQR